MSGALGVNLTVHLSFALLLHFICLNFRVNEHVIADNWVHVGDRFD